MEDPKQISAAAELLLAAVDISQQVEAVEAAEEKDTHLQMAALLEVLTAFLTAFLGDVLTLFAYLYSLKVAT